MNRRNTPEKWLLTETLIRMTNKLLKLMLRCVETFSSYMWSWGYLYIYISVEFSGLQPEALASSEGHKLNLMF